MDSELFKVEKTGTYSSHDGSRRTFVVAGTDIPADQARELGLLNDKRAGELKAAAEQAAKQGSADFIPEEPEAKNVGAAPENKAK